jgi:hypothetical protein
MRAEQRRQGRGRGVGVESDEHLRRERGDRDC